VRVSRSRHVADAEAALAAVLDPAFDARHEVVLEGAMPHRDALAEATTVAPATTDASASTDPIATSRIVARDEAGLTIETTGDAPGWVVLVESWDPGWSVTVDGTAADSLRANYLFRAVHVPPGEHRIVWRFALPGLPAGIAVASIGLLLALLVFLRGGVRRIATPPSTATRAGATPVAGVR